MRKKLTECEKIIYSRCSKRIDIRAKELKLTNQQIYPADDRLISKIRNNYVDEKNNPYLITDAIIGRRKRKGKAIPKDDTILHTLKFSSKQELLWGSIDERKDYILSLFISMIEECSALYNYDSEIDSILCAYVPFALFRTYYKILYEENIYPKAPAIQYGIKEDYILGGIDDAKYSASQYVFYECKDKIITSFEKFTEKTLTFKKLPIVIADYFKTDLLEILKNYKENSYALGYRVEDLIFGDLRHLPAIDDVISAELIEASINYLKQIEEIQLRDCKKQSENINDSLL